MAASAWDRIAGKQQGSMAGRSSGLALLSPFSQHHMEIRFWEMGVTLSVIQHPSSSPASAPCSRTVQLYTARCVTPGSSVGMLERTPVRRVAERGHALGVAGRSTAVRAATRATRRALSPVQGALDFAGITQP